MPTRKSVTSVDVVPLVIVMPVPAALLPAALLLPSASCRTACANARLCARSSPASGGTIIASLPVRLQALRLERVSTNLRDSHETCGNERFAAR